MDTPQEGLSAAADAAADRALGFAIVATYGSYLLGALYVVAPVLAWVLAARCVRRRVLAPGAAATIGLPVAAWAWLAGMGLMALALVVAHIDFALGAAQAAKSLTGWGKGWALLALFIVVGCLCGRPETLYRAACVVGAQTLAVLPLFVLGYLAGLPEVLYVSPIELLGGPGPEFFDVSLYSINPEDGTPRWRLFTPWAPALGLVGNVYFFLSRAESDIRWRVAGMAGAVAMILVSSSRLALVSLVAVSALSFVLTRLQRPSTHFALGGASLAAGLAAAPLLAAYDEFMGAFHAARPESSRVRASLAQIAIERWSDEAILWGHGIVERGPHLVEYMAIGTHHSWYGLLFVKGVAGLLALAMPFAVTLAALVVRAQSRPVARTALEVCIVLVLFSFGENLEILAYLFWPALVLIGMALRRSEPAAASPIEPLRSAA
jgi:hypothetical protein